MVGQRYYSPELGRFLQVSDVSEFNPSSINGLNLYVYANNNPISFSYNNSSVVGSTNVAGGLVSSIGEIIEWWQSRQQTNMAYLRFAY